MWERWLRRAEPGPEPERGRDDVSPAAPEPTSGAHADEVPGAGDPADTIRPVTRKRIRAALLRRGYRVLVDENDDVCGLWGHRFFTFRILHESVLQVRGHWTRQGSIERLPELLAFTDSWNGARSHPKAYLRVRDDGRVAVQAEVSVPISRGLNDIQLDHHLAVGLAASSTFFDEADRHYPDPLLEAP